MSFLHLRMYFFSRIHIYNTFYDQQWTPQLHITNSVKGSTWPRNTTFWSTRCSVDLTERSLLGNTFLKVFTFISIVPCLYLLGPVLTLSYFIIILPSDKTPHLHSGLSSCIHRSLSLEFTTDEPLRAIGDDYLHQYNKNYFYKPFLIILLKIFNIFVRISKILWKFFKNSLRRWPATCSTINLRRICNGWSRTRRRKKETLCRD